MDFKWAWMIFRIKETQQFKHDFVFARRFYRHLIMAGSDFVVNTLKKTTPATLCCRGES